MSTKPVFSVFNCTFYCLHLLCFEHLDMKTSVFWLVGLGLYSLTLGRQSVVIVTFIETIFLTFAFSQFDNETHAQFASWRRELVLSSWLNSKNPVARRQSNEMRHNFIRSEFLLCTFSEKNGNAIFVFLRKPVSRRIARVFNFVLTLTSIYRHKGHW